MTKTGILAPEQLDEFSPEEVLTSYPRHTLTVNALVASRAAMAPGRTMIVDQQRQWTWGECLDEAALLAGHLRESGVRRGHRVALIAPNSGWHVLVLLASARLGAIFVPMNPDLTAPELSYMIELADPTVVLHSVDRAELAAAASPGSGILHPLGEELLAATPVTEDRSLPDDSCIIIFTSGTTGYPKAVLHTQRTLLLAGEGFVARVRLQPTDRCLVMLPLFHINAVFYSLTGALSAGATLVIEPKFSASRFWSLVEEQQITQTNMIEAIGAILLKRPAEEFHPDHTLRKVYGIRESLSHAFRARFDVPHLVGGYGMTEIPAVLATAYHSAPPTGSMGRLQSHPGSAQPLAECRIVEDGEDVAVGEVGELWVRTPTVMLGYYHDVEQTDAAFVGQWFRTGDLVRRDEDDWFHFVARRKDIIRRRGENISGAELDREFSAHPDVILAAAIGIPSDMGDEEVLLVVTPDPNANLRAIDIRDHAADTLSPVKAPRYLVFRDQLPLTSTGKVAKHLLKQDQTLIADSIDLTTLN
ncbi:class I adenylate-forming enzyme family protein [Corynebacterium comes]|uniref:Long-chain-fatty-acid--CoA ligase n=1 Tax=Corynebacterium comes TaxID=2675218 RepID=A0A6B8VX14_9CORY|nr:AMP-binding protein [Corynebacterium comes]QGU05874.1 Long-chain-fatty-acid--CoA ligase [Corynebacterium comes]